jgi:hypothetical protein
MLACLTIDYAPASRLEQVLRSQQIKLNPAEMQNFMFTIEITFDNCLGY